MGRVECIPPPLDVVAALPPRKVVSKILDMELHPSPISGKEIQRHAPFFPHHVGLIAVGGQPHLDVVFVRLVSVLDSHQQPLRGLARFDPPGAFPSTGEEACSILAAETEVALDLAVPAGKT